MKVTVEIPDEHVRALLEHAVARAASESAAEAVAAKIDDVIQSKMERIHTAIETRVNGVVGELINKTGYVSHSHVRETVRQIISQRLSGIQL